MLRATGEARYREKLDLAVSLILRMGRRLPCGRDEWDMTFGDVWASHVPFLDNHASCVLALARAAWHGDPDGRLSAAVNEGILGIKLHTAVVDLGNGHTIAADSLATLNTGPHPHADTGFWNFKLGVTLRALHAAEHAADAGKLQMGRPGPQTPGDPARPVHGAAGDVHALAHRAGRGADDGGADVPHRRRNQFGNPALGRPGVGAQRR